MEKKLKKLAWDYILNSNGEIKVVIGFDIIHGKTKEATLSIWRPRYIHEDGEELDILEVEEITSSKVCHPSVHRKLARTNLRSLFEMQTVLWSIGPILFILVSTTSLQMRYRPSSISGSQPRLKYHIKRLRNFSTS